MVAFNRSSTLIEFRELSEKVEEIHRWGRELGETEESEIERQGDRIIEA